MGPRKDYEDGKHCEIRSSLLHSSFGSPLDRDLNLDWLLVYFEGQFRDGISERVFQRQRNCTVFRTIVSQCNNFHLVLHYHFVATFLLAWSLAESPRDLNDFPVGLFLP